MNLETTLNNLLKEGKIKKQKTDTAYLNNLLAAAHRNFEAAILLMDKVEEAAYKLVYDGLLQIGRVILLLNGYRPDDGQQHKTTFLVAGEMLGEEYHDLISKIQKFRIKRNDFIYEAKGLISKAETDAIFNTSRDFWHRVRIYLENKNSQLKLFRDL